MIKELEGGNVSWECLLPRLIVKTVLLGVFGDWGWVLIEINIKPNLLCGNSAVHFKGILSPGIY